MTTSPITTLTKCRGEGDADSDLRGLYRARDSRAAHHRDARHCPVLSPRHGTSVHGGGRAERERQPSSRQEPFERNGGRRLTGASSTHLEAADDFLFRGRLASFGMSRPRMSALIRLAAPIAPPVDHAVVVLL